MTHSTLIVNMLTNLARIVTCEKMNTENTNIPPVKIDFRRVERIDPPAIVEKVVLAHRFTSNAAPKIIEGFKSDFPNTNRTNIPFSMGLVAGCAELQWMGIWRVPSQYTGFRLNPTGTAWGQNTFHNPVKPVKYSLNDIICNGREL